MSAHGSESDVQALQLEAERAMQTPHPREQIVRILEKLLTVAVEGSEACRFAHRHLAELYLEQNPWSAALHLRRVLHASPDDDTAHALMGLCQALQNNFRMAVTAFRRAVSLAPSNPWYNHNLGHLLDVALDAPSEALPFLRRAHRAQPDQEEVGASLVHCLGRLGLCAEALATVQMLRAKHPRHADLRALEEWLRQGAPPRPKRVRPEGGSEPAVRAPEIHAVGLRPVTDPPAELPALSADEHELRALLADAGCTRALIERATAVWKDYKTQWSVRPSAFWAAAIEYALARVDGIGMRQRDVAVRHGVSVTALASRYAVLRDALKIVPGDARYVASPPGGAH